MFRSKSYDPPARRPTGAPGRAVALLSVAAALAAGWPAPAQEANSASAAPVAFNRDIRPILTDNCLNCHGLDPSKRKADLRLDLPEGATATNKDGAVAIKPGDLKASDLWHRQHRPV